MELSVQAAVNVEAQLIQLVFDAYLNEVIKTESWRERVISFSFE